MQAVDIFYSESNSNLDNWNEVHLWIAIAWSDSVNAQTLGSQPLNHSFIPYFQSDLHDS